MKAAPHVALKRLEAVLYHIDLVRRNALRLAEALIEAGECDLAVSLMHNVLAHDQSKLRGIEWDHLGHTEEGNNRDMLALAVEHHNRTNPHHPEYWGSIENMPPVYLAEAVCDWKARSSEFATSLHEWIEHDATKRYGFTPKDRVYQDIRRYVKLLVGPGFAQLGCQLDEIHATPGPCHP